MAPAPIDPRRETAWRNDAEAAPLTAPDVLLLGVGVAFR